MKSHLFTFIIAYKHRNDRIHNLRRVLDWVAGFGGIEIIIVDDNSTDETILILETYTKKYPNISIYKCESNLGYVKNFERGFKRAKGYFIAPSDQDDIWHKDKLRILFENIDTEVGFYFLHSYYFECENISDILATTQYGETFASAVCHENVYGIQFHPEKSHHNGISLLKNYSRL